MIGNAALLELPGKVAFLSSRRVTRRPKNEPIDSYQAIAVYAVGDATMEGEASEAMTIENLPHGTALLIR